MPKRKAPKTTPPDLMSNTSIAQIRSFVRRALNIEGEMDALKDDRGELYKEAKGLGFDVKILRKVVARRRADPAKLSEEAAILELYEAATQGDLFDLPGMTGEVQAKAPEKPMTRTEAALVAVALADVLAFVRETGKVSASAIQRKFQLGYNAAAALVEQLEAAGVCTPADARGQRQLIPENVDA